MNTLEQYNCTIDEIQTVLNQERLDADEFLRLVLKIDAMTWNSFQNQYNIDHEKLEKQKQLIEDALINRAANINNIVSEDLSINIECLQVFKEILLNNQIHPLTPDNYLKLVLFASSGSAEKDEESPPQASPISYKLAEEAIKLGANVNITIQTLFGNETLLDLEGTLWSSEDIAELLKAHGAKCGDASNRMAALIQQEKLHYYAFASYQYAEQLRKNLEAPKAEINKIPFVLNHVWFTHPQSPREIDNIDIENVIRTRQLLEKGDEKWTHIVWSNDLTLIPNSVSELKKHGIEVRSIHDVKDQIRLFDQIIELINKKLWGIASDTFRYVIIELNGGVYADLDLVFKPNKEGKLDLEVELYKYDFLAQSLTNDFFAAKKAHPIILTVLDIVESNLLTPPPYIADISEYDQFTETIFSSLLPFSLAYLKSSNLGSNIDMLYPPPGEKNNHDMGNEWLDSNCPSPWDLKMFQQYLGICGDESLFIGESGERGLTWLAN